MTIETKRRVAKGLQLGLVVGVLVGLSGLIQTAWLADPIPALAQTVTVDSTQSPLVVNALADLANLTPTDGQSVIIKTGTEKGLWYYDKDSVAVVDSVAVLTGPGSVGRFLVINNDAGSIAAATAITAAQIDNDVDLEFGVFDADSPRSLTLAELKKTGVQVINVKQYGATVNGVADDTAEIQAALTAAGDDYAVVIDGPCYVSDSLTIPAGGRLIGVSATAELIGPEDWFNKPVVILNGDYCVLENIKISETNASAQNQDKDAQASNIGVDVRGAWCVVRDVHSDGFGFPFSCSDPSADGSRDNVIFERCIATNGINWGFELDSVQNARYLNCTAYTNGYDGFKVQNQYDRTCDGLYFEGGISYDNGQRDTAAGGFESTNGNGWDLYDGGYRYKLVGCRAYANYGAGFNVKGGGVAAPIQGEGSFVNCESTGNLSTSGGVSAGIEIGTGGDVGHSFLSFTNCLCADNDGTGIYILGGYGITCTDCRFIKNKGYGTNLTSGSSDITFQSCSFARNSDYQAAVGSSNSGAYLSKRVKFLSCYFNASYDPFLAATSNSWSTAAEAKVFTIATADTVTSTAHGFSNGDIVQVWKYTGTLPTGLVSGTTYWVVNKATDTFQLSTTKGGSAASIADDDSGTLYVTRDAELAIRIYTDSADVSISDCSFANHWSTLGQVYSTGKRVSITRSKFYKGNTCSLTIGNGTAIVRDCYFKDPDLTGSTSIGVLACVGGSTSVYDCEFERSGGASGTAVRFYNGSTLNRFERLTATNFSSTIVASAGTTFATVEASTAGSGAPNVLTIDESPKLLTNEGTTAANYHTLPTASEGLSFTFAIPDTDGMRITAATGDTIRLGANVTATAGYVESTSQGGYLTVTAINTTEWIGLAYGTWTNGTWTYEVLDTP